jgi:fructose-1,6-bisphosphatase I
MISTKSINLVTLNGFILINEHKHPNATGNLSGLLRSVGLAAKIVHREVNHAGLADILGDTGAENIQGETVKKLDEFANNHFIAAFQRGKRCCGIVSEENDDMIIMDENAAQYLVCMDPLDGSSNIDVNIPVGTIFSIYKRNSQDCKVKREDFLQAGTQQVAAGYVLYGSSTMLVYTTGEGVNGFTLDTTIGEFCMSHPDMKIPEDGKIISANLGNISAFPQGVQDYVEHSFQSDKATKRPYALRYVGSMVADIHRTLLKGGIFMYPPTTDALNGKLRLLYECNPISFIIEQAGGTASNGKQRILELTPNDFHERTPIYCGSKNMVNDLLGRL